jgi:hypothetical protein
MNERIQELITKASRWEKVAGDFGPDTQYHLDGELLAELIVKECIYLVEKNKPDEIQRKEFPTDFIEGWENNSEVVIEDLMLHFGVNE